MDCRDFQKNLEDYLEGGLDFPGRFGMERHAQQCYVCGKGMANAQRLNVLAKEVPRVNAPANFESSVLARIHARDSRSWFRDFWVYRFEWPPRRSLALGASSLALAGVAIVFAARAFNWLTPEQQLVNHQAEREAITATIPQQSVLPSVVAPFVSPRSNPAEELNEALVKAPVIVSTRRRGARSSYSTEEDWRGQVLQADDADYVEYAVPGQGNLIMRLPKIIRMRHVEPSQEHFIRNVSH